MGRALASGIAPVPVPPRPPGRKCRTSLLLALEDRPGSLFACIGAFNNNVVRG